MKYKGLIAIVLVITSLLLMSCGTPKPTTVVVSPLQQLTNTVGELQVQVASITNQIANLNPLGSTVATLQSQLSSIGSRLNDLQSTVENLPQTNTNLTPITESITALQEQVKTLLANQSANTVIGTTPVIVNGLSVVFITNNVYLESSNAITAKTVQLSVKITNANSFAVKNVDITGVISFSPVLTGTAAGYPILVDASGTTNYTYYYGSGLSIVFECYNQTINKVVSTISIPANTSITLRPRITVLGSTTATPASSVVISLTTIAYDK